MNYFQFKII